MLFTIVRKWNGRLRKETIINQLTNMDENDPLYRSTKANNWVRGLRCVGYRLDGKSSEDLGHTTNIQTCFIWIKLRRIERSWRLRRIERSWRPRRIERRWICLNLYYIS
ncbi:hypothetical protein LINPERHAP1_LOCUS19845 [Linum perenne]